MNSSRNTWRKERNETWFTDLWANRNNPQFDKYWKTDFRISRSTFQKIIELVQNSMEKSDTNFRRAIPVEKRVAAAIWRLATGNTYRTVGKTFAIAKSTAVKVTQEFVSEINRHAKVFIKFPSTRRETLEAMERFKITSNCVIPQVVGAIDGTHIEILCPSNDSRVDYFNRKQRYSMNTQGVVGGNLIFLDIATGYPGSIHDSRVLRQTALFQKATHSDTRIS